MVDTILIADDEEPVRRTFAEWLRGAGWNCEVIAVADAEAALAAANEKRIDLAILDWNLGSGSDGLQLLEDLVEFHPDIVAILVTGFAHQATPLDALRMGVRDYLDKNQDLNQKTFLAAVRKQLDRIGPAKRQREFDRGLRAFRGTVEKILPLVRDSAKLNEPVPISDAVRELVRFLIVASRAADGVLCVRSGLADKPILAAYSRSGDRLPESAVPFSRSLAASAVSMEEPSILRSLDATALGAVELQPFEKNRRNALLAPLAVGAGISAVIELFDSQSPEGFTEADRKLAAAACGVGTELLRHALAERQQQNALLLAVEAALKASDGIATAAPDATPEEAILEPIRTGLAATPNAVISADASLRLVEAIRVLALRHGEAAVDHCTEHAVGLKRLLDAVAG